MKLVVSLIGFPLSGKRTLACHLAQTRQASILGFEAIRLALKEPNSSSTREAARLVSEGQLIPETLLGTILRELVDLSTTPVNVLVGLPRSLDQLHGFRVGPPVKLLAFFLDASAAELDRRFVSLGKDPIEVSHPGALERIRTTLDPLLKQLDHADQLVVLRADEAPDRLVAVVEDCVSTGLGSTVRWSEQPG